MPDSMNQEALGLRSETTEERGGSSVLARKA